MTPTPPEEPKPKKVQGLKTTKKRMTKRQQRQRHIWQYVVACKPCGATFTCPGKDPNVNATYICRLCRKPMKVKNEQVMSLEEAKQLIP